MYELLLYSPLILAGSVLLFRRAGWNRILLISWPLVQTAGWILLFSGTAGHPYVLEATRQYFHTDGISALFVIITGLLFIASGLHSVHYLEGTDPRRHSYYTFFLLLFIFAVNGMLLALHLGAMWVFMEATTLAGAMLIYHERKKHSIEAAWKYIFICSIGIAFAFIGMLFLSVASDGGELFIHELREAAGGMNKAWLKLGFTFCLIGFGTKAGLAPVHSWLPDAHSEAQSPISAVLSGALLNGAFLAIVRVSSLAVPGGFFPQASLLMLFMGLLSVFIAAVFVQKTNNYKRMLAYSSVENMGIMMIGVACGPVGLFGALLHGCGHSLIKSGLFLTAGNILHRYGSKQISAVSGLMKADHVSGWLWGTGLLFITAAPPSVLFVSEFTIVKELIGSGRIWAAVLMLLLLSAVLYGMVFSSFKMLAGERTDSGNGGLLPWYRYAPQILFLVLAAGMGLFIPESLGEFLKSAATAAMGKNP